MLVYGKWAWYYSGKEDRRAAFVARHVYAASRHSPAKTQTQSRGATEHV